MYYDYESDSFFEEDFIEPCDCFLIPFIVDRPEANMLIDTVDENPEDILDIKGSPFLYISEGAKSDDAFEIMQELAEMFKSHGVRELNTKELLTVYERNMYFRLTFQIAQSLIGGEIFVCEEDFDPEGDDDYPLAGCDFSDGEDPEGDRICEMHGRLGDPDFERALAGVLKA